MENFILKSHFFHALLFSRDIHENNVVQKEVSKNDNCPLKGDQKLNDQITKTGVYWMFWLLFEKRRGNLALLWLPKAQQSVNPTLKTSSHEA